MVLRRYRRPGLIAEIVLSLQWLIFLSDDLVAVVAYDFLQVLPSIIVHPIAILNILTIPVWELLEERLLELVQILRI